MYEVQLIGRLGKDAETKAGDYGSFVTFTVAYDEWRRDGSKQTVWVNVRYKPKEGSNIAEYLTKGTMVYVKGRPGAYAGTDGNVYHTVTARQIELLGGGTKKEADGKTEKAVEQMQKLGFEPGGDPDLPF